MFGLKRGKTRNVILESLSPVTPGDERRRRHEELLAVDVSTLTVAERKTHRRLIEESDEVYGRPIDLVLLLKKRNKGAWSWTIVDPIEEIGILNGTRTQWGDVKISGVLLELNLGHGLYDIQIPKNFILLPQPIRNLATDEDLRSKARWIGVLYQPKEWKRIRPDPALVAEWKSDPGKYYCLAAWGHDKDEILMFVDRGEGADEDTR